MLVKFIFCLLVFNDLLNVNLKNLVENLLVLDLYPYGHFCDPGPGSA